MAKNFKRLVILIFLAIAPLTAFSAELGLIDGIWQDESRKENYYSITQNGTTIVMIDLKRLEAGRDTLAATYTGALKQDSLLTPLAPYPDSPFDQIPIQINFVSDTEATILPVCDVCISPSGVLRKIFK